MEELDFAPASESNHQHIFLIYSLQGCVQCDKLFHAMKEAHGLVMDDNAEIPIFAKKIDSTVEARTNKAAFVERLMENHGYVPRQDGRVLFPICVYNGKVVGGYQEGYVKFCSIVDEYVN